MPKTVRDHPPLWVATIEVLMASDNPEQDLSMLEHRVSSATGAICTTIGTMVPLDETRLSAYIEAMHDVATIIDVEEWVAHEREALYEAHH